MDGFDLVQTLDDSPKYKGSSHDDETARKMGFRAALIPGAFLYGHATRLAVCEWGMDWIERGWAQARFRRPVYNGDRIVVERGAFIDTGTRIEAEVTIRVPDRDEVVMTGAIGLPHASPPLPEGLAPTPLPDPVPDLGGAEVTPGTALGARPRVLTAEAVAQSLRDFGETEAIYTERNLVHSGCLVRCTMGDVLSSHRFPVPVIFVAVEAQNLAPVHPGATITTAATVADSYERKGRRYFVSDEWLLADGRPVAHHRRENLY